MSPCGLISLVTDDVECLFMCLWSIGHPCTYFSEVSVQIVCPFLIGCLFSYYKRLFKFFLIFI